MLYSLSSIFLNLFHLGMNLSSQSLLISSLHGLQIQLYQHIPKNSNGQTVTLQLLSPEKSDPNTLGLKLKVVDFCDQHFTILPAQMAVPALELEIQIQRVYGLRLWLRKMYLSALAVAKA